MNNTHKFTFADLCAGIGGFRIALDALGGTCLYSCDIDKDCETTYKANYNDSYDTYDIHDISVKSFPKVDILCAGFPCQPFSIAGKRNAFEDYRSQVFFKIISIAKSAKPKVVFLENVPNIASVNNGEVLKKILNTLKEIGYTTFYQNIDSANFGIPQARKRLFIVAYRKELTVTDFKFVSKIANKVGFRHFINSGDYSIPISAKWNKYIDLYVGNISLDEVGFPVPKTRTKLERMDSDINLEDCIFQIRSSGIRALSIEKPLPTLAVSISGGGAMIPVYSKERRHLSILEMKRLMGFPDNFLMPISRTNSIKQLANAVCPPVITAIANDILLTIKH
jgi:DNA (cytosine-5)-methyltransferase 1